MPLSHAPPQKLCIKCTEIKNQKSAVITLFEITIIKINYNLKCKSFIHLFTCVSSVPVTSRQDSVTSDLAAQCYIYMLR